MDLFSSGTPKQKFIMKKEITMGNIDVDFEFLPFDQKENYVDFLAQLSERLHEKEKIS